MNIIIMPDEQIILDALNKVNKEPRSVRGLHPRIAKALANQEISNPEMSLDLEINLVIAAWIAEEGLPSMVQKMVGLFMLDYVEALISVSQPMAERE